MLRFAEEVMLRVLGDDGEFARVPRWPLHCALAGGVLMDLALEGRIDPDPDRLSDRLGAMSMCSKSANRWPRNRRAGVPAYARAGPGRDRRPAGRHGR